MALREYLAQTLREMSAILRAGGYPIRIDWRAPDPERPLIPLEADILADIKAAIVGFAEVPNSAGSIEERKGASGFFVADAFTNADYIQYALKTAGAAMF